MKENLMIITEFDHQDGEYSVIGICDSVERSEEMITEYFGGGYTEIKHNYIGESTEYIKVLLVTNIEPNYKVTIYVDNYRLNEV